MVAEKTGRGKGVSPGRSGSFVRSFDWTVVFVRPKREVGLLVDTIAVNQFGGEEAGGQAGKRELIDAEPGNGRWRRRAIAGRQRHCPLRGHDLEQDRRCDGWLVLIARLMLRCKAPAIKVPHLYVQYDASMQLGSTRVMSQSAPRTKTLRRNVGLAFLVLTEGERMRKQKKIGNEKTGPALGKQ